MLELGRCKECRQGIECLCRDNAVNVSMLAGVVEFSYGQAKLEAVARLRDYLAKISAE